MRTLTPSHYQKMIEHYKKHMLSYERMYNGATDEEFKESLAESIEACAQGIAFAQQKHDDLLQSATFVH